MSEADAPGLVIRTAAEDDVPLVLALIKELAEYERMADQTGDALDRLADDGS